MLPMSLVLVGHLGLAAQMQADEAAIFVEPVECTSPFAADPDTVAQVLTAPEGGRWWLARATQGEGDGPTGSNSPFTVVDGGGNEHLVEDVYITPAAVSLAVPASVSEGAVLQLRENDVPVTGVLLRVSGTLEPVTVDVTDILVTGVAPEDCSGACTFPGMTVPATPLLHLTLSGGPAILDAWALPFNGAFTDDLTERVIDSQLVVGDEEPLTFTHPLEGVGFTAELAVRLRLRDPHSFAVLYEETRFIGTLPEIPVDSLGIPACESPMPMEPGLTCATSGAASSAATLLLAMFACLVARSRVRARCARSR